MNIQMFQFPKQLFSKSHNQAVDLTRSITFFWKKGKDSHFLNLNVFLQNCVPFSI